MPDKKKTSHDAVVVAAIIGSVGVVAAALIGAYATLQAAKHDITPTSTLSSVTQAPSMGPKSINSTSTLLPTFTPAPISISTSSQAPSTHQASTSTPGFMGYDFESGTQGWMTSEGDYKLATLDFTTLVVHSGKQALELVTELFGSGSSEYAVHNKGDIYRHTEALVYFSSNAPEGFDHPGPYDLTSKRISCFVYVPSGLVAVGSPNAYVRLIVKDTKFANQYTEAVDITNDNINQWIELFLTVSKNSKTSDPAFDPTQTNALGVRFDTLDGSTVAFTGSIYIDDCEIK